MSRDYYSEINLHLVWHTKNSSPLLTPTVEPITHRHLKKRIIEFVRRTIDWSESHISKIERKWPRPLQRENP